MAKGPHGAASTLLFPHPPSLSESLSRVLPGPSKDFGAGGGGGGGGGKKKKVEKKRFSDSEFGVREGKRERERLGGKE
jgi:hypothetical protein